MSVLGTVVRTGVDTARRGAEVALALPRIAIALEQLAGVSDDLRRLADASDDLRRLVRTVGREDVDMARDTLQQLVDAVGSLDRVVKSLNTTISPLQGATERLGRLVDRLPQGRRSRMLDISPGPDA